MTSVVKTTYNPLSSATRTSLFTHLAAMERAGLPANKTFALLKLSGKDQWRLNDMRKLLAHGMDIATAGAKSGLFSPLESRLIHAALSAGSPADTYQRLAETHAAKAKQAAAIKSRMAMPMLVFVIALFVEPLPELVAGSLSAGGYLLHALKPLAALAVLCWIIVRFSHWHETGARAPLRSHIDALLLYVPVFGAMHLRRNVADFVQSLTMLLEAGVPMFDALPDAVDSISNGIIREDFACIKSRMMQGATLAQSFSVLTHHGSDTLIALIQTGEAGGKLPEMLQRFANGEAAAVYNFQEQVAVWLPRVIYGIITLWVAHGILTSGAFMPQVPS